MLSESPKRIAAAALVVGALTGCASAVVMPKAHLYSPAERLRPGPAQDTAISGEAAYCTGLPTMAQNEGARQQALANIAQACGGEERYFVVREMQVSMRYRGAFGAADAPCPIGAGRAILFTCKAADTKPAAALR